LIVGPASKPEERHISFTPSVMLQKKAFVPLSTFESNQELKSPPTCWQPNLESRPSRPNRSRDPNSLPVSLLFDSAQLSERLTQQSQKTLSFGPTAKFASGGSTLLPSHLKLTSLTEWERSKLSPSLVNGFTCLELSIRRTLELVRSRSQNFAIVKPGGKDPNFSDRMSLNGQKRRSSKNLRAKNSSKQSF
jgi:hypothetical protein